MTSFTAASVSEQDIEAPSVPALGTPSCNYDSLHDYRAGAVSPWSDEPGVVEVYELRRDEIETFMSVALCRRTCNQLCCCFSNPVTGILGTFFPCIAGPCTEICCAYPEFKRRTCSRHVAITDKCVTIKTELKGLDRVEPDEGAPVSEASLRKLTRLKKKALRRPYSRAPTATFHSSECCVGRGIYALDQFGVDSEFECKAESSKFLTRRLYFDQIRSAEIIQDGAYRVNCGPFCCCGFAHSSSNIAFVRIDIGREDYAMDTEDLGQINPILIGLRDPDAFCRAVNLRARGGGAHAAALRGDGEAKVVDAFEFPVAPHVMIRDTTIIETGARAEDHATTLSKELSSLLHLFNTGALSEEEFANAKAACIKTYS